MGCAISGGGGDMNVLAALCCSNSGAIRVDSSDGGVGGGMLSCWCSLNVSAAIGMEDKT